MEPARGNSLLEILNQGPLPGWHQVLAHLAHAVLTLHDLGWEHGDIKPEHIFVDPDSAQVTLIDFSSARRMGESRLGQPYSVEWQHPNIGSCLVNGQADTYALALLTWCLVTGRHPFEREGRVELRGGLPASAETVAP